MTQITIGYDARVSPESGAHSLWSAYRRKDFLLLETAVVPLSTDRAVWPSPLDSEEVKGKIPSWVGPMGPLWEDLDQLNVACNALRLEVPKRVWLIAFSAALEDLRTINRLLGRPTSAAQPGEVAKVWEFLGIDVSDASKLSALSNCGYAHESELLALARRRWAHRLNQYHLFTQRDDAAEFQSTLRFSRMRSGG